MTIWRSVLIEANLGSRALTDALANALGVDVAELAIVEGRSGEWPAEAYGEVVAETWPASGESRLMVTLFLYRDPAAVEQVDDRMFVQALADRLGCAVLLPDEADTDPFNYLRFRPHKTMDRLSIDPCSLDECPMRIAVLRATPSLIDTVI